MYLVIDINEFDNRNVYYQEKVKNTVMENSEFIRIMYSTSYYTLNAIFINFKLKLNYAEKNFNKYKYFFNRQHNLSNVDEICKIEKYILDNYNNLKNKKPLYRISEQLLHNNIKSFNNIYIQETNDFFLKIYGIWENENEYGLTYKITDSY